MKILAAVQGSYGKRIAGHLKAWSPDGWTVETLTLPRVLPLLIDEPGEFLPQSVPDAELLLALVESEGAAQLVSTLAGLCGAKAVIVPVDNPSWLPPGLQSQLRQELTEKHINVVFPKTFCTLTENSAGFRRKAQPYQDQTIAAFARYFGKPDLELTIDPESKRVKDVMVEHGSPCGSTRHLAEKLVGMPLAELLPRAGLIVHQFPCLASMQIEEIDEGVFEPVMGISGYVVNEEIAQGLESLDSQTT